MSRFGAPNTISLVSCGLFVLAVAPVYLSPTSVVGMALFAFFSRICHQQAARSLILLGAPAAVCIRCLGIYAGAAVGSVIRIGHTAATKALLVALALNFIDVLSEVARFHGNLPALRAMLGLGLGWALGALLRIPDRTLLNLGEN